FAVGGDQGGLKAKYPRGRRTGDLRSSQLLGGRGIVLGKRPPRILKTFPARSPAADRPKDRGGLGPSEQRETLDEILLAIGNFAGENLLLTRRPPIKLDRNSLILLSGALLALWASPNLHAGVFPEGGGIIYGQGYGFNLKAPRGWTLDNSSGVSQGMNA